MGLFCGFLLKALRQPPRRSESTGSLVLRAHGESIQLHPIMV
jgi:hypothetical protein